MYFRDVIIKTLMTNSTWVVEVRMSERISGDLEAAHEQISDLMDKQIPFGLSKQVLLLLATGRLRISVTRMTQPNVNCSFRVQNMYFQNYLGKIFISSPILFLRKMNNVFKYLNLNCWFTECIDFLMLKLIKDQVSLFKFSASNLGELCCVVMALQQG